MKNLLYAVLGLLLSGVGVSAQEWTRFRGPNGTGISETKTVPTKISERDVRWKIELPGSGHSSPVFWGNKLFITSTGDKAGGISVICLNAMDGAQIWRQEFPLAPFSRHKFNSFAASTPAVDAERVYLLWNEPEHFYLTALDHQGKKVWQRDLGPFVSQHGCGISPILFEGKVIVGNEQDDAKMVPGGKKTGESFILAVDAKTGKTAWQTPRKSAVVAYSTPVIYQPHGQKASIIFNSQGHGIYAVNPDDGKVLWEYDQAFTMRSVSSPLVAGDILLGSCGSGGGGNYVTAVKAPTPGSGPPRLAWELKKSAPYVPTGIIKDNRAWLWSDSGIVSGLDPANGEVKFQERVGGNFFGSPVWIDGRLFCVSTSGELVVAKAGEPFEVLHRFPLNDTCHSTPAVANGRLYIRTEKYLFSLGGAEEIPPPKL